MNDKKPYYTAKDIDGKTPSEVADLIKQWRADDRQYFEAATDLLIVIELYLREAA